MPDHSLSPPQDWSDAFARLGPEAPPTDGWARLSAQLQAHAAVSEPIAAAPALRRRAGPARRWAWAAAVAAALPLAALWWIQGERHAPTAPIVAPVAATAAPTAGTPAATQSTPPAAGTAHDAGRIATAEAAAADRPSAPAIAAAPAATARAALSADRQPRPPQRVASAPARERRPAVRSAAAAVAPTVVAKGPDTAADVASVAAADTPAAALARLQGESAQLESLVALARDDRVGSGAATVMSAELDRGIAAIDEALSGTGLAEAERVALWQRRVDALRALAGVEGSQRWYAARGERYEDALVRVD
ncbi:hypothetical protein [Lysobacter firmicutimachus]|uniref:Uncharacterized protein n=1 Tax=Lysobacter firmicutimachus TaxID=1792846 RepID=A0ABU8D5R8_9GAMM